MSALTENGRPMRALRVPADAVMPMSEYEVWSKAPAGAGDTASWFDPLARLCALGYAERSGGRGGYRYAITDAGREVLS